VPLLKLGKGSDSLLPIEVKGPKSRFRTGADADVCVRNIIPPPRHVTLFVTGRMDAVKSPGMLAGAIASATAAGARPILNRMQWQHLPTPLDVVKGVKIKLVFCP